MTNTTSNQTQKTAPNKITQEAGLIFNVNEFTKSMKEYVKTQDYNKPKYSGSQVAVAALAQKLCSIILTNGLRHTSKGPNGIRELSRPTLRQSVRLHPGLREYYTDIKLEKFSKIQMYSQQFPVSSKEIDAVRVSISKELKLSPKALNFLCFLLVEAYLDTFNTALQFIEFAKRKTLDVNAINAAINNRFQDTIAFDLTNEVIRATKAAGNVEDGDNDEGEAADDNEQKTSKKDKKAKQIDQSSDEDEVQDDEEDEDEDEENDDDVVEVKKKTKNSSGKSKSKGK